MKKSIKNLETKSIKTLATVKGGGWGTTAVVGSIGGTAVVGMP